MSVIIIIIFYILLYTIIMLIISHFGEKLADENIFIYLFNSFIIISTVIIIFELPLVLIMYNIVFLTIAIMFFTEVLNISIYKYLRYLYPILHMFFVIILTVYTGEISVIEKVLYTYKNHVCSEIYNNVCIFFQLPLLQFEVLPSNVEIPSFNQEQPIGSKVEICYNLIGGEGKQLGKVVLTTAKNYIPKNGLQPFIKTELPPEMAAYADYQIDRLHKNLIPQPKKGLEIINNSGILCSTLYSNKQSIEATQACLKDEWYRNKFLFIKSSFFPAPEGKKFELGYYRFWNYINHHQVESCLNEMGLKLKIAAELKEFSYEDFYVHPLPNKYKSGDLILMCKGSNGYAVNSLLELKVTEELSNNRVAEYKYKIFDKIPPGTDIRKEAHILCGDMIDAEKAAILRYELWKRGIIVSYYYADDLNYHQLVGEATKNFDSLGKEYDEAFHVRAHCVKKLKKE